jgi:hypothetical protein
VGFVEVVHFIVNFDVIIFFFQNVPLVFLIHAVVQGLFVVTNDLIFGLDWSWFFALKTWWDLIF